jgi:hypothetical protein
MAANNLHAFTFVDVSERPVVTLKPINVLTTHKSYLPAMAGIQFQVVE